MSDYKWKPFILLVSAEEVEKVVGVKLEAGKYYKTRDGRKVEISEFYEKHNCFYCTSGNAYQEDGKHGGYYVKNIKSKDIISEWTESPIREVTRRELVEWKDDVLHVVPHENGCALVGFIHPEDQHFKSLTAEQFREASHIFAQIAEYLEIEGK